MLKIWFDSGTKDIVAKKKNKAIADAAKNTIKELGYIEVYSSKTNMREMKISNEETVVPYWGGVDFELDDEIDSSLCERRGLVKEIVFGKIIDTKHENQEINGIERIII